VFAIVLGVTLVALAIASQFLAPDSTSERGSAVSSQPHGRRALFLLLGDLGFRAQAWSDPPGALPRREALLWLARAPEHPTADKPTDEKPADEKPVAEKPAVDKSATKRAPVDQGLRALSHYKRFVEEGGTLLLPQGEFSRSFLIDTLGFADCADVHASRVAKPGVRRVHDDDGEELEVDVKEGGVLVLPDAGSRASVLWRGGDEVLAMSVPAGKGRVVVLGDDGFLANEAIGEHDHALLAVRLAEAFAPGKQILFDEYALGLEHPRTTVAILASPSLFLATLHVVVLLALLVLRSAWVREFPRDPAPLESASPLLRARTLGALLARACRFDVLARSLRDGVASRLDRRSRVSAARVRAAHPAACANADDLARWNEALVAMEREVD
jgi:hypothetical protein